MAVELYSFFRRCIIAGFCKVCRPFDTGNRTYSKLTVKLIYSRDAFKLQKCSFFYILENIRKLFIPHKHFDHNSICKISNCKHYNCFVIADLPGIKADDLSPEGNLSHLSHNRRKLCRIIVKISPVDQIRVSRISPPRKIAVFFPITGKAFLFLLWKGRLRPFCTGFFGGSFFLFLLPALCPRGLRLFENGVYLLPKLQIIILKLTLPDIFIKNPNLHRAGEPLLKKF